MRQMNVIPAKAGIHLQRTWIPAFAGMTQQGIAHKIAILNDLLFEIQCTFTVPKRK
jgi:hypothetical protein